MIPLIPLEKLSELPLPAELDGSLGKNRATATPLITVSNDMEAISAWLAEYANRHTTYRNYRKEAERLLLWALIERQKPLSSLEGEDLLAYSQFLDNPTPQERWCGPRLARNGKRWSSAWRPFVGPLSKGAKITAFAGLNSLFNYLLDINYLVAHPMRGVKRQVSHQHDIHAQQARVVERIISPEEWFALQDVLEEYPDKHPVHRWEKARLRFMLALFYFAGLRIEELVSHTMGAFQKVRDYRADKDRWWLYVTRKGGKVKKIPVNQALLTALQDYRKELELTELPLPDETEPLIRSQETKQAITTRRVNQIIKALAQSAAKKLELHAPEKAARLRKLSAHWLRHLSLSMQDLVGMRKQHIKENAGHENERTTEIYLHAIDEQRHDEMEKLAWRINKD
ncbi:hypothetical protein BH10PSE19_BH10PSE19_01710 [soil metagenome]